MVLLDQLVQLSKRLLRDSSCTWVAKSSVEWVH